MPPPPPPEPKPTSKPAPVASVERASPLMTAEAPIVTFVAARSRVSASTVAVPAKSRSMPAVWKATVAPRTRPSVWWWVPVSVRSTVADSTVLRVWAKAPVTSRSQVWLRARSEVSVASVSVRFVTARVTTSAFVSQTPSQPPP
ncbi:MAG: hypothetical protein H6745_01035 [Deltaproteobacteria bacterium]|nr:hypothetical protein [Deltaproteobacteria bacterium]